MEYRIKYIQYHGSVDGMIFEFDDKYQLLSTFLSCDVTPFDDWIIESLDEVLSGQKESGEINGNVCGLKIGLDTTKVYDNLAENAMGHWCEVDTRELRDLVDEWCTQIRIFKEKYNK